MSDETDSATVLELAAELTVAWLSNPKNTVSTDELPGVIAKIHGALAGLSSAAAPVEAAPEYTPAVTVRKSLASREHLISLIDGKPYKMLKRHLSLQGLTPAEYRERYGLKSDYPMVAEAYAEKRRDLAKKIGLGRKLGHKVAPAKAASSAKAASPAKATRAAPVRKPAKAKAPAAVPADTAADTRD